MNNHGAQDQDSVTVHDYEGTSTPTDSDGDTSPSSSSPVLFREFVESGMLILVPVEERENNVVIKNISEEVEIIYGEGTVVVAVHKIKYTGLSSQVRLECFRSFRQAVAARRGGDANVQYGWYGGSRAEICDILRYGFGRCGIFDKGLSHGVGVYLSPENNQLDSVMRTIEDENGIRHMLLCRIILGKTEKIRAGSEQVYPSSTEFDTGVDNPLEPSTYIIWSAYMNSHILPVSIFSFREPSVPQGNHRITRDCARKPNSPIRFSILFNALSKFLHTSKTRFVLNCYNDFRVRVFGTFPLIDIMVIECVMCVCAMPCQQEYKIDRSELIRRFRSFAGDDVLISAVKNCVEMRECTG